jgi:hypothetical protein
MADNAGNVAVPSWRDAYKVGANQLQQTAANNLSSIAFKNLLNNSAVPIGSSVPSSSKLPTYSDNSDQGLKDAAFKAAMDKGGLDALGAIGGKIYNTPVIKQVLDALSVGTYAGANVADDALTGIDKVGQGDLGGLLDIAASPLSGIGKGAMAATGNANEVKTWSDVIAHGQRDMGLDPEDGLNKTIAGIGGFVGDVALDPTTYLTVGGTALAKGAAMGLKEGGKAAAEVAAKAVKDAGEVGGAVAPRLQEIADNADNAGFLNRFTQAKGQAAARYADYKAANGGKAVGFQFPFRSY